MLAEGAEHRAITTQGPLFHQQLSIGEIAPEVLKRADRVIQ